MIVLDASAVVELVLGFAHAGEVAERIGDADQTLHAPHLLTAEVAQVIRRFHLRGHVDHDRGAAALDDVRDLGIDYVEHAPLLRRVWELRHDVTAYDGLYLALAETLDAPLLTCDRALASVADHDALVLVLGAPVAGP